MTPKTRPGSVELGGLIRGRREELGLSIEQAAAGAGVGSETWRRYEGGAAMRRDKVRGLCKVLRWPALPEVAGAGPEEADDSDLWDMAVACAAYSPALREWLGDECARTFALGFDLTLDQLRDDIERLGTLSRGSHLGELGASWTVEDLPRRWRTRYDYDFCYRFCSTIETLAMRLRAPGYDGILPITRCPADDLALHIVLLNGFVMLETDGTHAVDQDDVDAWEYEINGRNDDIIAALFSDSLDPRPDHIWHVDNWFTPTYCGPGDEPEDATGQSEQG